MAVLDLDHVRALRLSNHSRGIQSTKVKKFPRVIADINICRQVKDPRMVSQPRPVTIIDPMVEIEKGPALWMWDYLRRSGGRGFFLPLSGGADSSSTAALVASMCKQVFESITIDKNENTLNAIRKVVKDDKFYPNTFQDITNQVFVTAYLGTTNSSEETLSRSQRLAEAIGAHHYNVNIDDAVAAIKNTFVKTTGKDPKFVADGGTYGEDLAL